MRILRLGDRPDHTIDRFGSERAIVTHLGRGPASVVRIALEPGGVIGMHPAVEAQLFVVVSGSGTVRADDGDPEPIAAGDAVLWEPGEEHETRSESGLVAIVVEAPDLDLSEPR